MVETSWSSTLTGNNFEKSADLGITILKVVDHFSQKFHRNVLCNLKQNDFISQKPYDVYRHVYTPRHKSFFTIRTFYDDVY